MKTSPLDSHLPLDICRCRHTVRRPRPCPPTTRCPDTGYQTLRFDFASRSDSNADLRFALRSFARPKVSCPCRRWNRRHPSGPHEHQNRQADDDQHRREQHEFLPAANRSTKMGRPASRLCLLPFRVRARSPSARLERVRFVGPHSPVSMVVRCHASSLSRSSPARCGLGDPVISQRVRTLVHSQPSSSEFHTVMVSRLCSTIRFAIARPQPVPVAFRSGVGRPRRSWPPAKAHSH